MKIRLDVHAHLVPLHARDVQGMPGVQWHSEGYVVLDGAAVKKRELYEPSDLIAWMDRHGVHEAWVSPPPSAYRAHLTESEALAWTRMLNRAMAASVREFPRLRAMAHLPVWHPEAALELAREATSAGQCLFSMPAGDPRGGRMLSDAEYEPLWKVLHAHRAFLMLHPAGACDPRFSRFSLTNLLAGPTETAMAAAHLAMSGTLERYPDITMCLAHGGGTIAAAAGRLQRGQDTNRQGAYLGGEKVRTALRRFCVDCITHDGSSLQHIATVFGDDRILFGSDWPFDMGLKDPAADLASAPARIRDGLAQANPQKLLADLAMANTEPLHHG
jgi:aminocarboxymuconate-semialdehyde decarboxylase